MSPPPAPVASTSAQPMSPPVATAPLPPSTPSVPPPTVVPPTPPSLVPHSSPSAASVPSVAVALAPPSAAVPAATLPAAAPAPTSAPLPIVIEPLPPGYDPAHAPLVAGLAEPPIVIHDNRLILSPSVFKHLLKDAAKLAALRAMPTDRAMTTLKAFLVAYLKAKAEKKRKAAGEGDGAGPSKAAKAES